VTASGSQENNPPKMRSMVYRIEQRVWAVKPRNGFRLICRWSTSSITPAVHLLDDIVITSTRSKVSVDGRQWTQVVDRSDNTSPSTPQGQLTTFAPHDARYVKITMLKNSANPSVHLVQLRVYEAPGISN